MYNNQNNFSNPNQNFESDGNPQYAGFQAPEDEYQDNCLALSKNARLGMTKFRIFTFLKNQVSSRKSIQS